MTKKKTILSGVQPSGKLHFGNYFGAIKQHIEWQDRGNAFYFIANYHSLTSFTESNKHLLLGNTLTAAIDYLALGLDPKKATFFIQSDVPQVNELAWILGTLCPVSWMEKGVSYKDKIAAGLSPNIGLFTYPILQAADILIYHSDVVPVGKDQKQNIEFARDLAHKFNSFFDVNLLRIPRAQILKSVGTVPGIDGQKMSKSYGNDIGIFDSQEVIEKKVKKIKTDSIPFGEPINPEEDNVFALIKLFADEEKKEQIESQYRSGEIGFGSAKKELMLLIWNYTMNFRDKREELHRNIDYVIDVLMEGGKKARNKAEEVMEPIREKLGIISSVKYTTDRIKNKKFKDLLNLR